MSDNRKLDEIEAEIDLDEVVDLGNGQTKRFGDCTAADFMRAIEVLEEQKQQ